VVVTGGGATAKRTIAGELQDLSLGGARLALAEPVAPNASLTLEFRGLALEQNFHAVVVHVREVAETADEDHVWIVGVRFANPTAAAVSALAKIIEGFHPNRGDAGT
jgi:c-di-GMP-binding flagellar brake protein YcgR